jgi:Short C-terminal domain/Phospholipase_D-nuclease N-terminal
MHALHLAAAQNYPALNFFWTMLEIFFFVIWIFILFRIINDVFRSHDMGGGAKALWLVFIIFLPFLGVLVYLIVRGSSMHERDIKQAQDTDAAMRAYIQSAAPAAGSADQLAKLAELKDKGVLTDAEFNAQKAKLLG